MIGKLLEFLQYLREFFIGYDSEPTTNYINRTKTIIQKNLIEVKTILNEMNDFRKEELIFFTVTFQNIVNGYKVDGSNAVKWPLTSDFEPQEHFEMPTPTPNSILKDKSYILNKLFFNDLFFYYYDFRCRMFVKFSEKVGICEGNLEIIRMLVSELQKSVDFFTNELGLELLYKQTTKTFSLNDFLKELENIVHESFEIERNEIYELLICDVKSCFSKNIAEGCQIYNFIQHLLKNYNRLMTKDDKSCLEFQNNISMFKRYSVVSFENNFLNFLTLDIIGEFEKNLHFPKDKRFKTYREYEKTIKNCEICKKYCKDMLRNVRCVKHDYILLSIRKEYFKFMDNSTFTNSILSSEKIFEQLYLLFLW